jgi:hypothetical protein
MRCSGSLHPLGSSPLRHSLTTPLLKRPADLLAKLDDSKDAGSPVKPATGDHGSPNLAQRPSLSRPSASRATSLSPSSSMTPFSQSGYRPTSSASSLALYSDIHGRPPHGLRPSTSAARIETTHPLRSPLHLSVPDLLSSSTRPPRESPSASMRARLWASANVAPEQEQTLSVRLVHRVSFDLECIINMDSYACFIGRPTPQVLAPPKANDPLSATFHDLDQYSRTSRISLRQLELPPALTMAFAPHPDSDSDLEYDDLHLPLLPKGEERGRRLLQSSLQVPDLSAVAEMKINRLDSFRAAETVPLSAGLVHVWDDLRAKVLDTTADKKQWLRELLSTETDAFYSPSVYYSQKLMELDQKTGHLDEGNHLNVLGTIMLLFRWSQETSLFPLEEQRQNAFQLVLELVANIFHDLDRVMTTSQMSRQTTGDPESISHALHPSDAATKVALAKQVFVSFPSMEKLSAPENLTSLIPVTQTAKANAFLTSKTERGIPPTFIFLPFPATIPSPLRLFLTFKKPCILFSFFSFLFFFSFFKKKEEENHS